MWTATDLVTGHQIRSEAIVIAPAASVPSLTSPALLFLALALAEVATLAVRTRA